MKRPYEKLIDDLINETGHDSECITDRVWYLLDRGVAPIDIFDKVVDECLLGKRG